MKKLFGGEIPFELSKLPSMSADDFAKLLPDNATLLESLAKQYLDFDNTNQQARQQYTENIQNQAQVRAETMQRALT